MQGLGLIDFTSFWSAWYWILTAVVWSMTSHFVMGVPYDAVQRAERYGEVWEQHCDALAHVLSARLVFFVDRGGPWAIGFVAFLLSLIATLGFGYGFEIMKALFMLVAPLSVVAGFSARLAYRIQGQGLTGVALRRALVVRRRWNQATGVLAIFCAAIMAGLQALGTNKFILWPV